MHLEHLPFWGLTLALYEPGELPISWNGRLTSLYLCLIWDEGFQLAEPRLIHLADPDLLELLLKLLREIGLGC